MRTETTVRTLYQYDELPTDEAREKAREWFHEGGDFSWSEEWRDSLKGFTGLFPVKAKKWEVRAYTHSFADLDMTCDEDIAELRGVRLWKYLQANYPVLKDCPWTGFMGDEDILYPYREFLKKPVDTTFKELMQDCLDSWAHGWQSDMEDQLSEETTAENIRCNEYEFTENGEIA